MTHPSAKVGKPEYVPPVKKTPTGKSKNPSKGAQVGKSLDDVTAESHAQSIIDQVNNSYDIRLTQKQQDYFDRHEMIVQTVLYKGGNPIDTLMQLRDNAREKMIAIQQNNPEDFLMKADYHAQADKLLAAQTGLILEQANEYAPINKYAQLRPKHQHLNDKF